MTENTQRLATLEANQLHLDRAMQQLTETQQEMSAAITRMVTQQEALAKAADQTNSLWREIRRIDQLLARQTIVTKAIIWTTGVLVSSAIGSIFWLLQQGAMT